MGFCWVVVVSGFRCQVSDFPMTWAYKVRRSLFSRGRDFGPGAYLFVVLGTSTACEARRSSGPLAGNQRAPETFPPPALLLSASPLFLLSSSSPPIFSREGEHLWICVVCFGRTQMLGYARPGADLSVVLGISTSGIAPGPKPCGCGPGARWETNMRLNSFASATDMYSLLLQYDDAH